MYGHCSKLISLNCILYEFVSSVLAKKVCAGCVKLPPGSLLYKLAITTLRSFSFEFLSFN